MPPDIAWAKQASKESSSTTGSPLSLQSIFLASFSRSWWLAIATRFSKDAMARFGVKEKPSLSEFSLGVVGMLAGVTLPLLPLPCVFGASLDDSPLFIVLVDVLDVANKGMDAVS